MFRSFCQILADRMFLFTVTMDAIFQKVRIFAILLVCQLKNRNQKLVKLLALLSILFCYHPWKSRTRLPL